MNDSASDQVGTDFTYELEQLLNHHSKDSDSNTPDFILSQYLDACLVVFANAMQSRDKWYSKKPIPDQVDIPWKTMDSAPKDGTWILVRGRNAVDQPMIPVVVAWCPPGSKGVGWFDSGSFKPMDNLIVDVPAGSSADWAPIP